MLEGEYILALPGSAGVLSPISSVARISPTNLWPSYSRMHADLLTPAVSVATQATSSGTPVVTLPPVVTLGTPAVQTGVGPTAAGVSGVTAAAAAPAASTSAAKRLSTEESAEQASAKKLKSR